MAKEHSVQCYIYSDGVMEYRYACMQNLLCSIFSFKKKQINKVLIDLTDFLYVLSYSPP